MNLLFSVNCTLKGQYNEVFYFFPDEAPPKPLILCTSAFEFGFKLNDIFAIRDF